MACLTNINDENWGEYIKQDQYKLVKQAIYNLMNDIRPNAVSLVDSFDYPDFILKSTIGRYDGNVYEALYDAAQLSVLNKREVFDGYKEYLRPHLNIELLKKGNVNLSGAKF
jgi:acyl-CoA oxidase